MRKIEIQCKIESFDTVTELDRQDQLLISKAEEARMHAYSPYSKFSVGAAALLANQMIVLGSNQENSSFPAGICAERIAISAAASLYPGMAVKAVAVTCEQHHDETPIAPCGICRQSLVDLEHRYQTPIRIILHSTQGKIFVLNSAQDLLPLAFVMKA